MTSTQKQNPLYVFDYQPLDELRDQIRLLNVHKVDGKLKPEHCRRDHTFSDGTAVVCCTIEHVSLSQPPSYKGLSYCWGDRSNTNTIHLNGAEVQITENLEAALLEAADSSLAFDLIQILSKAKKDSTSGQYEEALMRLYKPSENHKYDAHWTSFLLLFGRPYWSRVWIIQEIVSSNKAWIRCGSRCAIWEDVVEAVSSIPTAGGRSRSSVVTQTFSSNLAYMENVVSIDALRGFTQEARNRSEYVSLLSAMARSHKALSTIASDKVYGLLAIANDGQDLIPRPDYKLSAKEICLTVTAAIIAASADLDIICYAKASPRRTLPSWVPEWTKALRLGTMTSKNAGREDLYNATGTTKGGEYLRMPHKGEVINNGLVLKVRGFILDSVNGLGAVDRVAVDRVAVDPETVDLEETSRANVDEPKICGLIQPEPEQNRSQYGSERGIFRALWMSLVLGDRDDHADDSKFLNSLYVVQASDGKVIAASVDVFIQRWYSINKTFKIHGRALNHWFRIFTADPTRPERGMADLTDEEATFLEEIVFATLHKRLLFTDKGYIGMAPHNSSKGDKVCLLLGCRVPVVFRGRRYGGYELVGEAYVHGIMKGEAMTDRNIERLENFCIH